MHMKAVLKGILYKTNKTNKEIYLVKNNKPKLLKYTKLYKQQYGSVHVHTC